MADSLLGKLESRPKSSDMYLWCDYVELRCLTSKDMRFSRGELLEVLSETIDLSAGDPNADGKTEEEEDDDDIYETVMGDGDEDEDAFDPIIPGTDKREARVADIFNMLAFRSSYFGSSYPFELDAEKQELLLRPLVFNSRVLYLQLLLSASLRLVPKGRRHELTEPFEALSTKIFECLMPRGWNVHRFGAKGAVRYKGHLFSRLEKLAEDVAGKLVVEKHHFKTRNAGDGGLDIVAWHPLGNDGREGIPIAFAQCGCTAEEWTLKTLEASPAALGGKLYALHDWATYYFMPQDLVDASGGRQGWQRRSNLTRSIVIDRARLIRVANEYGIAGECLTAPDRVAEALEIRL